MRVYTIYVPACQTPKYVHLLNPKGHPPRATCESFGMENIEEQVECNAAYKTISEISGYTVHGPAMSCSSSNPNYCYTDTGSRKIFFTTATCSDHSSTTSSTEGIICKTCQRKILILWYTVCNILYVFVVHSVV